MTSGCHPRLESTIWFVCAEGVANVIKHAEATTLTIDVGANGSGVCVVVEDDGRGGADLGGSGLTGLRDRLTPLGGSLRVESSDGGTRVVAVLPGNGPRTMRWPLLPMLVGGLGAVAAVSTAALTLGERDGTLASYGVASPGAAVLEAITGIALFVAATLLAIEPPRRWTALSTFWLGSSGLARCGQGGRAHRRSCGVSGMLLVPMCAAALLLVTATLVETRGTRRLALGLSATTVLFGVVLWLFRDPFLDRYCWRDCLAHSVAPFADADRSRSLTNLTLLLGVLCGLTNIAIVWLGTRSARSMRAATLRSRWLSIPLAASGLALGVSELTLLLVPAERADRALFATLFVARALSLTAVAVALGALALRPRFVRGAIARLAGGQERSVGEGLQAALARALGDPELTLGYPLAADGSIVDVDGREVVLSESAIRIVRGGAVVALVDSAAGAPQVAALDRELSAGARLALSNERLRAEQLARLRELIDTRRRHRRNGRRRPEAARARPARRCPATPSCTLLRSAGRIESRREQRTGDDLAAQLSSALDHATSATEELRTIAHGIFPAVLITAGLMPALTSLTDTHPLALTNGLDSERRFPLEVEATAYAIVAEALHGATAVVRVEIAEAGDELVLTVDDAPWSGGVVWVEDRVGAVGGVVCAERSRLRARLPV